MKISILLFLTLLTCDFSTKTDNQGDKTKVSVDAKIELFFFPSGLGDESRYDYKVIISGNTLSIQEGRYYGIVPVFGAPGYGDALTYQRYDDDERIKILSEEEMTKLNGLIKEIGNLSYSNMEGFVTESWGTRIRINGKLVYETNGWGADKVDTKKVWELIDYIEKLSPVKLECNCYA